MRSKGGSNLYTYALNDPVNFIAPYGLTALKVSVRSSGAYALIRWAVEGTPLCEGAVGDWVYDNLHSPVNEMEKGERGREKANGDDPLYGKDVEQLKDIEKNCPDPRMRQRVKIIRKQKEKNR